MDFYFVQSLSNNKLPLNFWEIFFATLISIPMGFLVSLFINKRVLHKLAKKIKVSNKPGEIDIWSHIMNQKITPWVVVRDIENDLMYEGWVQLFSDSTERDELFLRDVKVFTNKSAQELYDVPALYLPKNRQNLTIEFPIMKYSEFRERQTKYNMEEKNE
jgi:hypothetical protein